MNEATTNTFAGRRGDEKRTGAPKAQGAIRLISSMAPRLILETLSKEFLKKHRIATELFPMGGVDAANRVRAGGPYDVVVLSKDAIETLVEEGHLFPDFVDIAVSPVAVAVPAGSQHPDLSSEEALKKAVLSAETIGYSTGPSGRALTALFAKWGIDEEISDRLVCPSPGVPVGSLIAKGDVALGFQQKSELIHVKGIEVVGPLPEAVQINTTFSAAVCLGVENPSTVRQLMEFLCSPEADSAKQRQGMQPA